MDQDVNDFLNGRDEEENQVQEQQNIGSTTQEEPEIIQDAENMRTLKIKIRKYLKCFPRELESIDISDIENLSEEELQVKYDDIRVELNSSENKLISSCYFMGVNLCENLINYSGYADLTGLTVQCHMNEGINKCLKQLEIEFGDYTLLSNPEERLVYLTLLMALTTAQQNKIKAHSNDVRTTESIENSTSGNLPRYNSKSKRSAYEQMEQNINEKNTDNNSDDEIQGEDNIAH